MYIDYSDNRPNDCATPPKLSTPTCPVPPTPAPAPPTGGCDYGGKGKMGSMMNGMKCKKGMKTPKEPKTPKAMDGMMSMGDKKMGGMKYKRRK
jgi:hypothetical protein